MCFSSQASFVAGVTLIMIGLTSVHRVYKVHKLQLLPLALTPLLFGIQQLLEGALWLGLLASPRNETLYAIGLHGFIWFSMFWWPCWLPFALARAETDKLRQRVMYALSFAGLLLGTYLVWPPYAAELVHNHIAYTTSHPSMVAFLGYLITGIVPFFISSLPFMWVLGILGYVSLLATLLVYFVWTTSIWCFFVAMISTSTYILLRRFTKR
jgi:hypothetical protein